MSSPVHKVKRPDRWDQPYGQQASETQLLEIVSYEPFSFVLSLIHI